MRHVLMTAVFVLFAVPMGAFAVTATGVGGQAATPPAPLFDAEGYFDGTVECVAHATYDETKSKCKCDDGYEGIEVEVDANEKVPKCQLTTANRALYGVWALIPRVDDLESAVTLNAGAIEALQTQRQADSDLTEIRYAAQVGINELASKNLLAVQAENAATNVALAAVVARVDEVETGLETVRTDVDAVEADVVVVKADVVDLKDRPEIAFGFHFGTLLGAWSSPTVELAEDDDELVRWIGHAAVTCGLHAGSLHNGKGVIGQFDIGLGPSKGGYDAAGDHDPGLEVLMRFSADYAFPLADNGRHLGSAGPVLLVSFADADLFNDQSNSIGAMGGAGFTWMPPSDELIGIGLGLDLMAGVVNYDYQAGADYDVVDETKFTLGANIRVFMTLDPTRR